MTLYHQLRLIGLTVQYNGGLHTVSGKHIHQLTRKIHRPRSLILA